jgi:hypothetical protein
VLRSAPNLACEPLALETMLSPFGSYLAEREPATHALASAFRVCGGVLSGCVLDVPWPGQALGASRGALGSVPNPARPCSSWWTLTREMCFRHEASPCRCVRTNQDPLLAWCRPGAGLVPASAAQLAALARGERGRRRGEEGVAKTRGMGSQAGALGVGWAGVGCHRRGGRGGGKKRVFFGAARPKPIQKTRASLSTSQAQGHRSHPAHPHQAEEKTNLVGFF